MFLRALILIRGIFLWLVPVAVAASDGGIRGPVAGPVEAELISVVDGDTLLVNARPWPQHSIAVLVRIRGIDAPELKSKCPVTRRAAERARQALTDLTTDGIRLTNIAGDKYFGRVVADVASGNEGDIATAMLAAGWARAYDGGRKVRGTC
jgi:micrococcal nuclease